MAIDKKIKYEDKPVIQGGVQNYLGKQPEVQAPRKWKSAPDKPETELAYITKAEKDLILKANIHGGLEKGPNMGPSGIMSLDSFGDADGKGMAGGDVSRAESGDFSGFSGADKDYAKGLRAGAVAAGARSGPDEDKSVLDQVKALQNKYGSRVGTNRFGDFFSPSNILSGLGSLISGPLGLATKAFGFLGDKVQDLRGYNPDGTPRTQAEYEQARFDRIQQDRINNILNRDAPITEMTQRNLEKLGYTGDMPTVGSTPTSRAIARDLAINPETTQLSRSYIQSLAQPNPNVTKFANPIGPRAVNVPGAGITGIDVSLPGNALMAGLTRMQKMGLKSKKQAVDMGLMSPQEALDSISPFNDPEDPATLEEVKEYYGIA